MANNEELDMMIHSWFEGRLYKIYTHTPNLLEVISPKGDRLITVHPKVKEIQCDKCSLGMNGGLDFDGPGKFTKEELEFFDKLGFEIEDWYATMTKQTIEEWFE